MWGGLHLNVFVFKRESVGSSVFSPLYDVHLASLTFPLALISLQPSGTWVIWVFIRPETHNENQLRDGANRIPKHIIEGKGGACTAWVIYCNIILMWLMTGNGHTQTHIYTQIQYDWPHCRNIVVHFLNLNNSENEITPPLHIPWILNTNWNCQHLLNRKVKSCLTYQSKTVSLTDSHMEGNCSKHKTQVKQSKTETSFMMSVTFLVGLCCDRIQQELLPWLGGAALGSTQGLHFSQLSEYTARETEQTKHQLFFC